MTINGEVSEIDSIGTVSSGVVTYNVKISFDVDDHRIKPGMSVSATIITETGQGVIVVPNTAIKNNKGANYVEIFDTQLENLNNRLQGSTSVNLPQKIGIKTGLVGDTLTEIKEGLKEGDVIITKTITGSSVTTSTKTSTPSILGAVGGRMPRD